MKLGELKKSLQKFPVDMDDEEMLISYLDKDGNIQYDNLGFVGVTQNPHTIILGRNEVAVKMINNREVKYQSEIPDEPII